MAGVLVYKCNRCNRTVRTNNSITGTRCGMPLTQVVEQQTKFVGTCSGRMIYVRTIR